MIHSVTVTNYLGESIKLELGFPEKSGFIIKNIDGLGPAKANINTTEISGTDGSFYNSARVTTRNIVLTLAFLFQPDIETMRQLSYKYFPLKKMIKLLFETDNRTCYAIGYVESNEPIIFSDQEETQISIICPNPYLYGGIDTAILSGVERLFEFPFSNESLTENLLEMSNIKNDTVDTIYYYGDAETGILLTIHAFGSATNITIFNTTTREEMFIDTTKIQQITGTGFITGDDIIISTVKGAKNAQLLRDGKYTNILNAIDKNSNWFQLSHGPNTFAYTAVTGINNVDFKIESQTLYEGV